MFRRKGGERVSDQENRRHLEADLAWLTDDRNCNISPKLLEVGTHAINRAINAENEVEELKNYATVAEKVISNLVGTMKDVAEHVAFGQLEIAVAITETAREMYRKWAPATSSDEHSDRMNLIFEKVLNDRRENCQCPICGDAEAHHGECDLRKSDLRIVELEEQVSELKGVLQFIADAYREDDFTWVDAIDTANLALQGVYPWHDEPTAKGDDQRGPCEFEPGCHPNASGDDRQD
ncbi:hypothetical protein H1S01_03160 [Heliobacterium chlorum]|uniref:Uncharacterized protein n=1 Tax=Heliobacterium chlorum TaxID=2698 RepID=A0ABR7SZT1_HELCL|nr:hypothetical protein [Heliobacterium chlorum]MBC9783510.1 hypothetical protein [Heliobacterium chlorum]